MAFDDQCGKVVQLRRTVCILPDAFEQRIECCLRRLAVMMHDHFADARFAQLLAGGVLVFVKPVRQQHEHVAGRQIDRLPVGDRRFLKDAQRNRCRADPLT